MSTASMIDVTKPPPLDLIECEPVRAAIEAHQSSRARAIDARKKLDELQQHGRQRAEEVDARALADAQSAGKKDPGPKHVEQFDRDLSEAKRQADAARLIETDRLRDAQRAVDEHYADWYELIGESDRETGEHYHALLDEAERLAHRLTSNAALRAWLDGRRFKGAAQPFVTDRDHRGDYRERSVGDVFDMLRSVNEHREQRRGLDRPL